MTDVSLIVSVTAIHIVALISPGPDFFMTLKNSITYSRKTGIYTAVGFGLGIAVHISYSLTGLALLISKSTLLFSIIKYLGVAYLLYIGGMSFFRSLKEISIENDEHLQDISPFNAIRIGFITNVLNPKATLFFLSLFTLIISPDTSNTTFAIISVILIITTILWFSLVAILLTQKHFRVLYNRYQKMFSKILGLLLIAIALKIAFSE